jgi:hypothetical protein
MDLDAGCSPSNNSKSGRWARGWEVEIQRKHYCLDKNNEQREKFSEYLGPAKFDQVQKSLNEKKEWKFHFVWFSNLHH